MTSNAQAAVVAMTIEALLTGVQFVTLILCMPWRLRQDHRLTLCQGPIHWSLMIVAILIFVFSVTDLSVSLGSILLPLSGGSSIMQTSGIIASVQDAVNGLTTIATDAVLIYRCWLVYDKKWLVVVPPLLPLLYNIGCITMVLYWSASGGAEQYMTQYTRVIHVRRVIHAHEGFGVATILINIYATTAIIACIYKTSVSTSLPGRPMRPSLIFAIRVIAESGSLYTLSSIFALCGIFISYSNSRWSQYPVIMAGAIWFPIAGVAYNLILMRVIERRAGPPVEVIEIEIGPATTIESEDKGLDVVEVPFSC